MSIVISYRRDDSAPYAGRLYDRLSTHFGEDRIFMDIDTMEPGVDFVEAIDKAVGRADALVVVIGPDWISARDERGKRRLDDPYDFVRMEVAAGLERGAWVVPVLVDGAEMPSLDELPENLTKLARRNALQLSDHRWRYDTERLISALAGVVGATGKRVAPRRRPERRPEVRAPAEPRRVPWVPLAGAGILALAVAAFLIGKSGGEEGGVADTASSASNSSFLVGFPSGWQRGDAAPDIPGLELADSVVVSPGDPDNAGLVVGRAEGEGPTLLPAAFRERLNAPPNPEDRVELGDLEAIRYAGLEPEGFDGTLTLYAIPATEGVAVAACYATDAPSSGFETACYRAATTIELSDGRALPLSPDEGYGRKVSATLARLNKARRRGRAAMRTAATPDAQANSATATARAHSAAATSLRRASVSPEVGPASERIVAALGNARTAYDKLAQAARADKRGAYRRATGLVERAERALKRSLRGLAALGYDVA